jgi:CheY-like chemotaxis protein
LNLVSNAIKFTEKGKVDITCSVLDENETEQTVQVTVSDTGIGMDESFVNNLFNKFTQEDESVTRRFGGTGLGMSICKELVELMGGSIGVNSKKGVGTSVSFTVSFKKGTKDQLPVKETHQIDTKSLTGKRILVTDDNEMNRLVAATLLEAYGAIIGEARNGEEAVEKIKENKYDLVLMDVQMPVMDGFEATTVIRNTISKDLPIIALTAFAIKGDNLKCFEAGMNDYLSKPFDESQLLHIVSKWISKNSSKMEMQPAIVPAPLAQLYNLKKLNEISKGNDAFVKKMVALFCDQTPASVTEMKEAYANNDFIKLKAVAHRIKPSIDNMGILLLKNEIRDIETNAETYKRSEQLEKLLSKVEQVISEVVQKLKDPI